MKALVLNALNEWPVVADLSETLETEDLCTVDLHCSSLNHRDVWIVKGQYPGIEYPLVLGSDGSGIFEGRRVVINPSIQWGDKEAFQSREYRILGLPDQGTFAESIKIPKCNIYDVPPHLTDEEAGALPLAGLTAFRALFVKALPKAGERVFITGIGGGVALFAMQFAIAAGLKAYVSSGSDEKIRKAIDLGASGGVNYRDKDWVKELMKKEPEGIDIIVDGTAGDAVSQMMKICRPGARLVIYGGSAGQIPAINPQQLFWKQMQIIGSTMGSGLDFKNMLAFVEKHQIRPVIDRVFTFSEAGKAFERMDRSEQFGKIVFRNRK